MQSPSPMLREDASMNHDDSDLPVDLIVRTTLDQQGQRRETFHVDCPRQDHLVGTGEPARKTVRIRKGAGDSELGRS